MKKTLGCILFLLAFLWQHCTDDQAPAKPGTIRFSLRPTPTAQGGRQATSLPEGASLYLSIRAAGGDVVYTLEPVSLLKFGNEYISEPLALPGGDYELTDFMVADSAGHVAFAAPREGSELAPWVDDPLPQAFTVSNDAVARIDVQVLPTDAYQPVHFGYVTFGVDVVETPRFKLSVFRAGPEGPEFMRAHAYLLSGDDTLYYQYLPSTINDIAFTGAADQTYTLVLQESEYKTYSRTFVLQDLLAELDGEPLQVILTEALMFTMLYGPLLTEGYGIYIYTYAPSERPFIVNWGDGTEEVLPLQQNYPIKHVYARPGSYHVSVSGDLSTVQTFHVNGFYDDIILRTLPELQGFSLSGGPDTIDISHNPELVSFGGSSKLRYVDVSHNTKLKYLTLSGNTNLPVPVLNQIITDLYNNAIEHEIYSGEVNLLLTRRGGAIGPPSKEAWDKLVYLAVNMGWILYPSNIRYEK